MTLAPDFKAFFRALWDYDPFPWQIILADQVAAHRWPKVLDLPTASGKTACIEIALYALAVQADREAAERSAPRRIWFVVDRRIVVDEAYSRATTIAGRLQSATSGPLRQVADRLKAVAGTERPLATARLRGGVFRDDGWARLPSQPAVITSTVDQVGSRLLFRGYGRSLLAAPIFAGLAANDSLIVLDEAHCSVPFLQTLHAVESYRGPLWAEASIPAPFASVVLSATPPKDLADQEIFPGDQREQALDHPVLSQRLNAPKPTRLVEVRTKRNASTDPLIVRVVECAGKYLEDHKRRVAVMVNRVTIAQEIASALHERFGSESDVVLLTGGMRPFERDSLVARWSPFLRASRPEDPPRPIILVSTQCLEVGADFSFDALITEAASLDALRQRFGRLDRMGKAGTCPATILIRDRDTDPEKAEPDPIYQMAIANTWQVLKSYAEDDVIDFGFEALRSTLEEIGDPSACLAPTADAPVLLPAHLDMLCQTAPAPEPEPDVELFLHGKDRGSPDVQVVWRADLDVADTGPWVEAVALCPPVGGEMLSVPVYRLRGFLAGTGMGNDCGDVEGVPEGTEDPRGRGKPFLLWRGRDRSRVERDPGQVVPGDILVVPASYGIGTLGQQPVEAGVGIEGIDLWERVLEPAGKPQGVRLTQSILAPWLSPPVAELVRVAKDQGRQRDAIDAAIDHVLAYQPGDETEPPAPPDWWCEILRRARSGRHKTEEHPAGGVVRFAPASRAGTMGERDLFADDDDLASAGGREVSLEDHTKLVERTAARIAGLCLPDVYGPVLELAAQWHDVGKLDERFQMLLHQGDELAMLGSAAPLAKSASVPSSPARRRLIRRAIGLPGGFRHEMLSTQLAERLAPVPEQARTGDLFLHLVASHHGHGRPFAPLSLDDDPPTVAGQRDGSPITLDAAERAALPPPHRLDSGIPDRFWRLVRRHGWWGLAYLEAILRLSDWYASEFVVSASGIAPRESVA